MGGGGLATWVAEIGFARVTRGGRSAVQERERVQVSHAQERQGVVVV